MRPNMSGLTYPNFLCIGAQKAGTTWLHAMLLSHREIWVPHLKEVHYFDRRFPLNVPTGVRSPTAKQGLSKSFIGARLSRLSMAKLRDRLSIRRWGDLVWEFHYLLGSWDDTWYASLFRAAGGKVAGEVTPAYSCLSETGIAHVHSLMPDAKVIFIMRDPIERAWSHACMDLAINDTRDISRVSDAELIGHFQSYGSRLRGDYVGTIARWQTKFDPQQMFLAFYDEIKEQPAELLIRIYQFLEVSASDQDIPPTFGRRFNAGRKVPLPARLRKQLACIYLDELRELSHRFGSYPTKWLANCERLLAT